MKVPISMDESMNRATEAEESASSTPPAEGWTEERERLLAEKAEIEDLLRRRQADFDNFRKRVERERADVYEDATMRALGQMLPVLDDFERALKSAPAVAEGPAKDYAKGMELIYQQMLETLGKMGMKALESEGLEFDPNLHHAVQKVEVPGAETEMVLEQYQRGYLFKEKLLRPAMVKVGVKG